jgi:hypothetical protein
MALAALFGKALECVGMTSRSLKVTDETIEGTGYDPTNSNTHESRFIVDLKTGRSLLPAPLSTEGKPVW